MEKTEKQRLIEFIESQNMNFSQFEKKANWANGYIKKNKGTISPKNKIALFSAFPELSPEWLETGAGEMLRAVPSQKKASTETTSVSGSVDACNSVNDFLAVIEREQQLNLKLVQQYERLLSLYEHALKKNP